jgi:hypothetical protein
MKFPARPDRLVLARLVAAAVGSSAGFDVEELDDLRLAVDELCLSVAEAAAGGSLCLRIATAGGEVVAWCTYDAPERGEGGETPLSLLPGAAMSVTAELSERILDALVDSHGRSLDHGVATAWFRKRRQGATR